jgi:hypothetical protein
LDKCPVLTAYEKELIRRVDVNSESQTSVAKSLGKDPSTVCSQHRKALEKFNSWTARTDEPEKSLSPEELDKECFKLFNTGLAPNKAVENLGHADRVYKLWEIYQKSVQNDYVAALNILGEWVKKEECSEYPVEQYPLAARVQKLRWDEFGEEVELGCIWDLLEEKGLTGDFSTEEGGASEAIRILVAKIQELPAALRAQLSKRVLEGSRARLAELAELYE